MPPCHSERSEESLDNMNWTLFKDILSIDSTSGKERELALWLHDHLDAPSKQLMEVGDGTLNLFLQWGTPRVVFCTHMDTVPPYLAPVFPEGIPFRGTPFASLTPAPPTFEVGSAPLLSPCGSRPISPQDKPSDPASAVRSDERIDALQASSEHKNCHSERSEESQAITGRGSCDAKGQLFAMYTACKQLDAEGRTDFGLLLLAGEETGSWGAKAFSKTGFTAPFLIVGEPTDNKMVSAAKGTLSYDLKFVGKECHSGYPQWGRSAVDLFNEFYNALKAVDWGTDPELGETTWNIGLLHSDNPQNILSGELTCRLYFRTTFLSHDAVKKWMQPYLDNSKSVGLSAAQQSGRPEAAGDNRGQSPLGQICVLVHAMGDTPSRYVTLPGFESAPVAFGSDAPHLTGFGHKIICGPGSIKVAHRPEEYIEVKDLERAVEQYVKMYRFLQNVDNE